MLWGIAAAAARERVGPNFIARPYRGVSVQDVDVARRGRAARARSRSRRVYRRTEFIVAVRGDERALVQVEREDGDEILVGVARRAACSPAPDEVAFVVDPSVDTGNATPDGARRAAAGATRASTSSRAASSTSTSSSSRRRCGSASSRSSRRSRRSCSRWRGRCSTTTRTCRRSSSTSSRSTCASSPPRTRPTTTCSRAAAPGSTLDAPVDFLDAGPPRGRRLDARRLRALAPDPRRALRRTSRTRGSTSARCVRDEPGDGPTLLKCCLRERGHRARGRADDRAVGRDPRGGPRRRCSELVGVSGDRPRRLGRLRPPVGDRRRRARCSATRAARAPGCEIIAALAAEQGELGLIPAAAARARSPSAPATRSTSRRSARRRARRGHSTLGLIRVLQRDLGAGGAREWVYYGATVQDVTDTWFGARDAAHAGDRAARPGGDRGGAARRSPSATATRVMLGRTHGQPGLPITFGFKAARVGGRGARATSSASTQAEPRLAVGQLAGAVGTLSAWGEARARSSSAA